MVEAGSIPENYFTVWTNVFERGRLHHGETLLVHGGSSGIGTTAIQLAVSFGAQVFATAGSQEKCVQCIKLGARRATNYRTQDFVEEIREWTGGRGVDVILDIVGGAYVKRNLRALAIEGRLVQIAFLDGSEISADFTRLMTRRLTWTGSTLRPRSIEEKGALAAALREYVWPLLERGAVRPLIFKTFPLADAAEAHRLMESSVHVGKITLICDTELVNGQ
jgi:putative PIG3 family NAD(P)H quinone oxidoreductase